MVVIGTTSGINITATSRAVRRQVVRSKRAIIVVAISIMVREIMLLVGEMTPQDTNNEEIKES
jgi:hypothetical protein